MNDKIEKTIDLDAPVSRVWTAITDSREFGAWFRVDIEGPFVVGEKSVGRITYPIIRDRTDARRTGADWQLEAASALATGTVTPWAQLTEAMIERQAENRPEPEPAMGLAAD